MQSDKAHSKSHTQNTPCNLMKCNNVSMNSFRQRRGFLKYLGAHCGV